MLLGIDIGGTKTEICLVASFKNKLNTIFRDRMATLENNSDLTDYLERLGKLVKKNTTPHAVIESQIQSIGIGLPGAVQNSKMIQGSIPFLKGVDLKEKFEKWASSFLPQFSGNFYFENDANCFVLAEHTCGAGKDKNNVIGVTLGTGVGGGIVINGRLYRGSHGGAAEFGHMELIKNGRSCYCGNFGCAEQYISGTAFESLYHSRFSEQLKTASEIFQLSREKNIAACEYVNEYRETLAQFLAELINIFDPDLIVLGGGISSEKQIYEGLNELVQKNSFIKPSPPVLQNELGGSAGVIGAAYLGVEPKRY